MKQSILIIAGETSGDNVGGLLCAEIKAMRPEIDLFGLGGDRMKRSGVEIIHHVNELSFLGFWEVIKHIPFIKQVERDVLTQVDKRRPSLAILIDYPGFNLRIASRLKEMHVPVMYYVSPQVWAWGKGRIAKIKSLVDKMVVVFQFEQEMYRREGMEAEWNGHPLLEIVRSECPREDFLQSLRLEPTDRYIGLFPGSRRQEINRILPAMKKTMEVLRDDGMKLTGVVGCAPGIEKAEYEAIGGSGLDYVYDKTYELMAHADLNLVASGTATLECAILQRPLLVLYKTSALTYHIAKTLIKIPHIGLVNVVAGKKIAPEFIQGDCRGELLAAEIEKYFSDRKYSQQMLSDLAEIRGKLGERGASRKTAMSALSMVDSQGI